MLDKFELASGTTMGRDHRVRLAKNNQDGVCAFVNTDLIVAVVTDGCSSGIHSELGAVLGAQLMVAAIKNNVRRVTFQTHETRLVQPALWERIRQDVLAQLRSLALSLYSEGSFTDFVTSHFLFTSLGVVITPLLSVFFGTGDGLIIVNNERFILEPNEGNEPAYLGYALLDSSQLSFTQEQLKLQIIRAVPTSELDHFLVGTDGATVLLGADKKLIPGRTVTVGPIDQFWTTERFFRNPFALGQYLTLLNTDSEKIDWDNRRVLKEPGLLFDDTTIVVGRRKDRREETKDKGGKPHAGGLLGLFRNQSDG